MWLYTIIFLIPLILYFMGSKNINRNPAGLALFLFALSLFVGLSDMFGGYDRYIYGEIFDGIADITTVHGNYAGTMPFTFFAGEIGYSLLNVFISFFTANRYIFILAITLIIYLLLFFDIKRYTTNYPFALVLFLGLWFFFSFTYLRQVLGATTAWLAIKYVIDRKPIKFLIVWAIAFSLHNSAVIFLPLYFVPVRKFRPSFIIIIMVIALALGFTPLPTTLFSSYDNISQIERVNTYGDTTGFRVAYFLEAAVFLYIILRNYKLIVPTRTNIVLLNMALIFCALLLFYIRNENGGRISWYYMIGVIATITYICTQKRQGMTLPILMIVLCFGLYIRVFNSWQNFLNLYPYKTFLSNGYREGDYSWENYEYDHQYDVNKLYRDPLRFTPNL